MRGKSSAAPGPPQSGKAPKEVQNVSLLSGLGGKGCARENRQGLPARFGSARRGGPVCPWQTGKAPKGTQNVSLLSGLGGKGCARENRQGFPARFESARRSGPVCPWQTGKAPKGKDRLCLSFPFGAAEGSRTPLCSLGSCRSTDELQPRLDGIIPERNKNCNTKNAGRKKFSTRHP